MKICPTREENDAYFESLWDHPPEGLITVAKDGVPSIDFGDVRWRECRIWQGYFDSSSLLLHHLLERSPNSGALIFPAMFSLRHTIEVALKWHIRYAGGAVPKDAGHRLDILVKCFRQTAKGLDPDAAEFAECMFDLVSELAAIDPRSITFRYATELDGSSIIMPDRPWDLRDLIWAVGMLSIWFDHLSGDIDMISDAS
jgi:hypothetical protein